MSSWCLQSTGIKLFVQQLVQAITLILKKDQNSVLLALWVGNQSVTGGFSSQMDSNAESGSIYCMTSQI